MTSNFTNIQPLLDICTNFAVKYRIQFTVSPEKPDKSAIMIFNAKSNLRSFLANSGLQLQGKIMPIVSHYKYLGLELVESNGDILWTRHVNAIIDKAKRRSQLLLYKLRRFKGLKPRIAINLWNSRVRAIFESASTIWAPGLSQALINRILKVQYDFAKGLLGVPKHTCSVHVMAELGFEPITVRWTKLHLGYFRHLFSMCKTRMTYKIAAYLKTRADEGLCSRHSWLTKTKDIMTVQIPSLTPFWRDPTQVAKMSKLSWKLLTYRLVEHQMYYVNETLPNSTNAQSLLPDQPSRYSHIKDFENTIINNKYSNLSDYERPGALRLEPYLDNFQHRGDNRLKSLCRLNRLPLNYLSSVISQWNHKPDKQKKYDKIILPSCPSCTSRETLVHFLMVCPLYQMPRLQLTLQMHLLLLKPDSPISWEQYSNMTALEQMDILCGKLIGDPFTDSRIDRHFKKFLKTAWKIRDDHVHMDD